MTHDSIVRSNKSLMDVRIRKRSIIYIEIVYLLIVFFAIGAGAVPESAVYALDVLNLLAIVLAFRGSGGLLRRIGYWPLYFFFAFCFYLVVLDIANSVPPLLVIWAIRNTFRFFGFFMACAVLLDISDVFSIMKIFFVFQIINCFISAYQFFVLGIKQDNLGGIFGTGSGCNGYSNVFFCVLLAYYGMFGLSRQKPIRYFLFICISTLVLAALAEIKVYFFEFIVIVIVVVLLNAKRVRTYAVLLAIIAMLLIAMSVFAEVFPASYQTLLDPNDLLQYSSQGMAGYEISRFGAFEQINHLIFGGDVWKNLFGIGFGNAEYSANVSAFTSAFYNVWGLLNYRWFSHQMWYIETGLVGFFLFVSLFVFHALYSIRLIRSTSECKVLLQFVVIATIVTILNLWYNCTIRVEAAYITFFILSISCIVAKDAAGENALTMDRGGSHC